MGAALLQKLRADRDDTKARGNAIAAEAEKAGGYNDTQLAELEELETKMQGFDRGIAAELKRQEWELNAPAVPETPEASGSPDASKGDGAEKPFASFGEQLTAIREAAFRQKKGQAVDPRLHQVEATLHGASETVGQDGGFAVQKDFVTGLEAATWEQSMLASKTRQITVGANANGIKFNLLDETVVPPAPAGAAFASTGSPRASRRRQRSRS
jgi:HK97 family phage major capsid protein